MFLRTEDYEFAALLSIIFPHLSVIFVDYLHLEINSLH